MLLFSDQLFSKNAIQIIILLHYSPQEENPPILDDVESHPTQVEIGVTRRPFVLRSGKDVWASGIVQIKR